MVFLFLFVIQKDIPFLFVILNGYPLVILNKVKDL